MFDLEKYISIQHLTDCVTLMMIMINNLILFNQ